MIDANYSKIQERILLIYEFNILLILTLQKIGILFKETYFLLYFPNINFYSHTR